MLEVSQQLRPQSVRACGPDQVREPAQAAQTNKETPILQPVHHEKGGRENHETGPDGCSHEDWGISKRKSQAGNRSDRENIRAGHWFFFGKNGLVEGGSAEQPRH